jgi:hypothetical protein
MAFVYVQGAIADPGTADPAVTITPTVGDLLIVFAPIGAANPTGVSIADTQGNTWTPMVNNLLNDTHGDSLFGWWAKSKNSTSTTITVTSGGNLAALAFAEYSGQDPTAPADGDHSAETTNDGSTDKITSGAIVTTKDGDLIAGIEFDSSAVSANAVAGTGYTSRAASSNLSPTLFGFRWLDKVQSAHGSVAVTWTDTVNTTHDFAAIAAAFAPPSGGGGALLFAQAIF